LTHENTSATTDLVNLMQETKYRNNVTIEEEEEEERRKNYFQ